MSARRPKGVRSSLAETFDIPQEVVVDLPKLTMMGRFEILVENHKGIVEFHPTVVRLRTSAGALTVRGSSLALSELSADRALIRGTIDGAHYGVTGREQQ